VPLNFVKFGGFRTNFEKKISIVFFDQFGQNITDIDRDREGSPFVRVPIYLALAARDFIAARIEAAKRAEKQVSAAR
jgi:hypothetical protein